MNEGSCTGIPVSFPSARHLRSGRTRWRNGAPTDERFRRPALPRPTEWQTLSSLDPPYVVIRLGRRLLGRLRSAGSPDQRSGVLVSRFTFEDELRAAVLRLDDVVVLFARPHIDS